MKNVLLIDSGSGGVSVLKECLRVCPFANFLMFCDNKNLPYGDKSKEQLIELTVKNLENIRGFFRFDIVVFACNSLTSACIDACRELFSDVEFVGTVPAIKPALKKFKEEDVVVIATKVTIKHNKLISKHPNVRCVEMKDLARLIDENLDDLGQVEWYLREKLSSIKCKALVLGCTHYVAVKEMLSQILSDVEIFDGANGVARRLQSLLGEENENYAVKIMTSKQNDFWAKLWDYLNR